VFSSLAILRFILHREGTNAAKQSLQLNSCLEWNTTEALSYDEVSQQYLKEQGYFVSNSKLGYTTPSLSNGQNVLQKKWNDCNNNTNSLMAQKGTYTDAQMKILSIMHDDLDYGAGPCTATHNSTDNSTDNSTANGTANGNSNNSESKNQTASSATNSLLSPRRMERVLVQQLTRLCCVFTKCGTEELAGLLCEIVTPPLLAILTHTTSNATRKDVASAVSLLASRTEPVPLFILMKSGLPVLILNEAVAIHVYGRDQKTNRPHIDRELFVQCLLTLCAIAAQECVKKLFLALKSTVDNITSTTPLVFFCQICLATGKTRDREIEAIAALGIGALLDTSHRLVTSSDDNENSGSSSNDSAAPDVEGLVRVAVVASAGEESGSNSGPIEISDFEFRADILSSVIASFLRSAAKINNNETATGSNTSSSTSAASSSSSSSSSCNGFVSWLALAAVANLFSIFEVRNRLLGTKSLQVMLSLTKLLTASTEFVHGSGTARLSSQLEVVKALCTATKTPR